MKYGILFKNTPSHVKKEVMEGCSYIYGEISAIERILNDGLAKPSSCIPVISAFLGAKKYLIKKDEINYAMNLGVKRVLFYFDAKNVKFGYFDLFQKEINELVGKNSEVSFIIHLPIDYFSIEELNQMVGFLSKKDVSIMAAIEDKVDVIEKTHQTLSYLTKYFDTQKIQCLFNTKLEMIRAASILKANHIENAVYYA